MSVILQWFRLDRSRIALTESDSVVTDAQCCSENLEEDSLLV